MDCPCAKFGDFSFSRFWFYRADRQTNKMTDRQNHTQTRMIAILTRLPLTCAWVKTMSVQKSGKNNPGVRDKTKRLKNYNIKRVKINATQSYSTRFTVVSVQLAPRYYSLCQSATTSTVVKAPLARASFVKRCYTKYLALPFLEGKRRWFNKNV